MTRFLAYDYVELSAPKIVSETKRFLKIAATITKAGVYDYDDGAAFKCASELRKAARTARHAKLTLNDHPKTKVIMSQADLYGGIEKPFFDNNKIRAILAFDKEMCSQETLTKIRTGELRDVSIGFYYRPEFTPGWSRDVNTSQPRRYDYIMRDILIDHVVAAVAPGTRGRCTFPNCGIGVDTVLMRIAFAEDKVVKRGNSWCVVHCHPDGTPGAAIKCYSISEFGEEGAKRKAEAMHRAIQAQKHGASQGKVNEMSETRLIDLDALYEITFAHLDQDERPPKEWWDKCAAKARSWGATDPSKFCGWLWSHGGEDPKWAKIKASYGDTTKGGIGLSQETAYEKCVRIRMEAGAPREEAELACQDKKTDQDEEKTPWQKCIQKHMAEGLDKEQARMKCKEEGVAQDQAETPWQKCIAKHLKEGMSMEEAADKCKQEGVAQDIEEPAEPKETAPSPLETCIATRMEAQGEDEATAKKWCEDELAGLHAPAEAIVDSIKKLQAKDAQLKKR